jgi:cytochrome c556
VPVDQADFHKWAHGLADAGAAAYKAAQSKNLDQILEASGTVSDACLACHEKYRETPKQPDDRCMP